jgi:hypothetical protein
MRRRRDNPMVFIIKINMDNAAFETPEYEIMQRLNKIHDQVRDGVVLGAIIDTNGNSCGYFSFVDQDELIEAAIDVVEVFDNQDEDSDPIDTLEYFGNAADRCRKAVAKEIARQIGDWRRT